LRTRDLVQEIREDSSSGASQLTIKAANVFLKLGERLVSLRDVKRVARSLAEARPSMPSIANMAYRISGLVEEQVSKGTSAAEAIKNAVRIALNEYQNALRTVIQNAADEIRRYESILVHSYSSTVAAAIEKHKGLRIYITESRPGYEGRRLAEELIEREHEVTLIVDAAASYVIDRDLVDAVILGCDAVLDDGSIANKVGSKMIALAARDSGIPVNVVTDLWKASVYGFSFEEHPPEEIYVGRVGVPALNPYFEIVPYRLISLFITEKGLLKPQELVEELRILWGHVISKSRRDVRRLMFKQMR